LPIAKRKAHKTKSFGNNPEGINPSPPISRQRISIIESNEVRLPIAKRKAHKTKSFGNNPEGINPSPKIRRYLHADGIKGIAFRLFHERDNLVPISLII